jgi:hypothetical protein
VSRKALIGSTGFVGGALARQRQFDCAYNSKSIGEIENQRFDVVICAGAPATMWEANARPEADAANISRLYESLRLAEIKRLVLISTVAVFDDVSAGYTESSATFEDAKAYGRNRRQLELLAMNAFDCHVVRLPALFGPGLKKNFIFDLMNPVPSFVESRKFDELRREFPPEDRNLLARAFSFDGDLNMWRFSRASFRPETLEGNQLEAAFRRVGFISPTFTNSESRHQFYNIKRLADDIDRCIEIGIRALNICSTPLRAADIHQEVLGKPFENHAPARVDQDVRSEFAALFGGLGDYLYTGDQVLSEIRTFVTSGAAAR